MTGETDRGTFVPDDLAARLATAPGEAIAELACRLRAAQQSHLARLPVAEIVERIDHTLGLWLAPDSPWMAEAAADIGAATPYGASMVRHGLARLLAGCRKAEMLALLEAELGDPLVLDGWQERRGVGGQHHAVGPALTVHVFAGNVPGLPAISLIHALLVKSASLGKPASEEPRFPALFARSLAAVDPELAATIAIVPWAGGAAVVEEAALAVGDAVVVHGSDGAVDAIRRRVRPDVRFVGHGHRISFAVIGRETLSAGQVDELAARLAYDVSLFDQQGCVSAHLAYVERGGEVAPEAFAERLASAMDGLAARFPRGAVSLEESAAIQRTRDEAELRELRGEDVRSWASPRGTGWTVIYEADSRFAPSCLNRVVRVKPVESLEAVARLVAPISRYLQTVGTALKPERERTLGLALTRLGACRLCPIGAMPHPPLAWHHDGGFSLLPLLRWCAIEA